MNAARQETHRLVQEVAMLVGLVIVLSCMAICPPQPPLDFPKLLLASFLLLFQRQDATLKFRHCISWPVHAFQDCCCQVPAQSLRVHAIFLAILILSSASIKEEQPERPLTNSQQ